jgi:hypothetical protein
LGPKPERCTVGMRACTAGAARSRVRAERLDRRAPLAGCPRFTGRADRRLPRQRHSADGTLRETIADPHRAGWCWQPGLLCVRAAHPSVCDWYPGSIGRRHSDKNVPVAHPAATGGQRQRIDDKARVVSGLHSTRQERLRRRFASFDPRPRSAPAFSLAGCEDDGKNGCPCHTTVPAGHSTFAFPGVWRTLARERPADGVDSHPSADPRRPRRRSARTLPAGPVAIVPTAVTCGDVASRWLSRSGRICSQAGTGSASRLGGSPVDALAYPDNGPLRS